MDIIKKVDYSEIYGKYLDEIYISGDYNDKADAERKASERAATYVLGAIQGGMELTNPADIAKVREAVGIYTQGIEDYQVPLRTSEAKIHAIKDIQREEFIWGEQGNKKDDRIYTIISLVFAGVGLIAAINTALNGRILDAITGGLFLGGLAGLIQLLKKWAYKGNDKSFDQMRFFYNISIEEELELLTKLANAGNLDAKEMIMIHDFIRGTSNGEYTVEISEEHGNLVVIPTKSPEKGKVM